MVSDMSMVSSGKLSRTAHKFRSLTIGFSMETPGKLKGSIFSTRFILEARLERPLTIKAMKDLIGKKPKLYWPEHMIPQSQDTLLLTQLVSGFGSLFQSMSLILSHLTAVTITRLWRPVKRLNTSQVYFIQMTQHNKASNSVLNSNICWSQPHFRILFVVIRPIANKTSENLIGKTSLTKLPFN
jgi:hypothetical protein